MTDTLTLAGARTMIRGAFDKGREAGLKPLAVAVLDSGGHLIAFERQDKASPGRFKIAQAKAYGAIMLGMGGQAQMARAESQPYFTSAINGLFDGQLVPVPGGILIRDGLGDVVGALGVSGDSSENDVVAGLAGIALTGFNAEA